VQCVSCHNPTNLGGGYGFDTYSDTIGAVALGAPQNSPLYTAVASGQMPKGGTPLGTLAVQSIYLWIQMGAPNN
jgi:mono/diheme cytochrome c family protein